MPTTARHQLSYHDLTRCQEILKPPFRKALGCARIDLLPPPALGEPNQELLQGALNKGRAVLDRTGGRLLIPLLDGLKPLGLLAAHGVSEQQLPDQVRPFLSALVETSLTLVRSRLTARTDALTGLGNESALDEALISAAARLTEAPPTGKLALDEENHGKGLTLVAIRAKGLAGWQERHGRNLSDQVLRELARLIGEAAPQATVLARVGQTFFMLLSGSADQARRAAETLQKSASQLRLKGAERDPWPVSLSLGAAHLGHRGAGPAGDTAALLKLRAGRALLAAERVGLDDLLFFQDIADRAGRVQEVMPLDRVLINLGRMHGLTEGDRLAVREPGQAQGEIKAEVAVSKLGAEESLAEVVSLARPASPLRPGDVLRRLPAQEASAQEPGRRQSLSLPGGEVAVTLEQATGALERRSLMAAYSALCAAEEPLATVVLGVEDLENVAEVTGRLGAEALLAGLTDAAREAFGPKALLGRYSPEALAVLLPGADTAQAGEAAQATLEKMREQGGRPVRAGVAAHPREGFTIVEALNDAGKALVHAGFLDPYSVVICDAVSLNISGDAAYGQGRLAEAVAEYEKALLLQAEESNVLNSLGVCHGRLGQMDEAAECFRRAREVTPEDYMTHYNLGLALLRSGERQEGQVCLQRSLELEPEHADTLFQLGCLAQNRGQTNRALDYLQRAAAQEDCKKEVHSRLGQVLATAGQRGQAEAAFKQAIKYNPRDAAAMSGLAGLYLERGANTEIALSLARRALQQEPGAAQHMLAAARALLKLDRAHEALDLLKDALARHPQDQRLQKLAAQAREMAQT
ncbi:MAG: diguanylate cyclase [Deltaproteobacteria bacterium]|nr:diguanylate cyclase [Deltaproteobacteria bacterium]